MRRFTAPTAISLPAVLLLLAPCFAAAAEFESAVNDSLFPQQKRLFEKLHVFEAWEMTQGSPSVLVGVIDNGFDFYHPDLKGQIAPGYYAPEAFHPEIGPNNAHGTLVSGIIGAKANNGIGMAGLAPECRILAASYGVIEHTLLKLQRDFQKEHPNAGMADFQKEMVNHQADIEAFGRKWTGHISRSNAEAIRYLVDRGVKVINMSSFISRQLIAVSSPESWNVLESAFTYAGDRGVIIVLGAGNNAREVSDYPGDDSFTIIAGASLLNDTRWEEEITMMGQKMKQGSCYGNRLTVMAPVDSMVQCVPHEARFYSCDDGPMGAWTESKEAFKGMYEITRNGATSSAAPVVTALVALVYSLRPDLDARSVVEIVRKGCDDIGEKGFDMYTGFGRVNYAKTLAIAQSWGK